MHDDGKVSNVVLRFKTQKSDELIIMSSAWQFPAVVGPSGTLERSSREQNGV